jgi:hypothetical protein
MTGGLAVAASISLTHLFKVSEETRLNQYILEKNFGTNKEVINHLTDKDKKKNNQ